MNARHILVTDSDMRKLRQLLDLRMGLATHDQHHLEMLARELDLAEVVRAEQIPADAVTMDSHVQIRDLDTGGEMGYTLVFPEDSNIAENKISILAPLGTALLGYREGDAIEWPVPGGVRKIRVEKVVYQPEAAGGALGHSVSIHRRRRPCYSNMVPSAPGKPQMARG
jgi:regulator of nucleoside diphosphate kinase